MAQDKGDERGVALPEATAAEVNVQGGHPFVEGRGEEGAKGDAAAGAEGDPVGVGLAPRRNVVEHRTQIGRGHAGQRPAPEHRVPLPGALE